MNSKGLNPKSGIFSHSFFATAIIISVSLFFTGNVVAAAEEVPSNAKLYKMILELKAEQKQLRAEANRAKAEATAAKNELAKTKRELSYIRQQPTTGAAIHSYNPGVIAKLENTFVSFGQEGGVADADGTTVDFGREYTPRLEIGYMNSQGAGIRGRYWSFDHSATSDDNIDEIDVDTHYFDLELFQRWQLSAMTELEGSVGLRNMEYKQTTTGSNKATNYETNFDGWGGTIALQAKRKLGMGKVYGRSRYSLLFGDSDIDTFGFNSDADDNPVHQVELGFGYEVAKEFNWGQLNANLGYEWQYWTNLGLADSSFGGIGNDDVLEDVSFQGWVLGVSAEF